MSVNQVNQVTGELNQAAGSFSDMVYADAPVGAIQAFGGSTAPLGWLMCDGSAVSRTTYAALFAVIGTRYGSGDGSTSFNLPSREAGAAVYPSADGNVLSESNYIIKAIKTAVPTDIQSELDLKQDITDNTLETASKTVPGAINELKNKCWPTAISVQINGTYGDIIDTVLQQIPLSDFTKDSCLVVGNGMIYRYVRTDGQFANYHYNPYAGAFYNAILTTNGFATQVRTDISTGNVSIEDFSSLAYVGTVDVYL